MTDGQEWEIAEDGASLAFYLPGQREIVMKPRLITGCSSGPAELG
ncbi:MAG: hypothetical protein ABWY00_10765 [Dongiaceae bacterium]